MPARSILLSLALLIVTLNARFVAAYQMGITGYSGKNNGIYCASCHGGGETPVVTLSGPTTPATLEPNQVGTFTFTVTSTNPDVQTGAGFNVAADAGTLQVVNATAQKEQLLNKELTHTAPRANDVNDQVIWTFKWKAPAAAGNYTLYGAGNSVNRDGGNGGDAAAKTVLLIAVGDVTPLATVPPTETPTTPMETPTTAAALSPTPAPPATPTGAMPASPTQTAVPSPTASATATSSPIPTDTATPTMTRTPALAGDANCDAVLTAADLPEMVTLVSIAAPGACGADINRNGAVDADDLRAAIELLFEVSP